MNGFSAPRLPFTAFWILCWIASVRSVAAQYATASKTTDISVFGGFAFNRPGFVSDPGNGVMAGVDVIRHFRWPVEPSIELRVNDASGQVVGETTYLFGVRAQSNVLGRFHPYGDFLAGTGTIRYYHPADPNYTHDNSTVYSYGGGLGLDVGRHFQAKIDYQGQRWRTGVDPDDLFRPKLFSFGVEYRIPFKRHFDQRSVKGN